MDLLTTKLRTAAEAPHIWWGTSVENRKHGLPRIDHLRQAPAKMRFLSVEPLIEDLGKVNLRGIHWMIVGGESGPGARPIDAKWGISLRNHCRRSGVPYFFKQCGGVRKKTTGRELEGEIYSEFPQRTTHEVPSTARRAELIESVKLLAAA